MSDGLFSKLSANIARLPAEIAIVLFDFDETLTREHTGGALQFRRSVVAHDTDGAAAAVRRIDLHRNLANDADVSLVDNAASGDLGWTFCLLYDLVMHQQRCVAIVTMADIAHGAVRAAQTNLDSQRYETLAGDALVRRWLLCAALVAFDNNFKLASQRLHAMLDSGRFVVVAHSHPSSKERHVRIACSHFFDSGAIDAGRLQARHMLYIDNTHFLLRNTAQSFPGMRTVHTPCGVDADTWQNICETCLFFDD